MRWRQPRDTRFLLLLEPELVQLQLVVEQQQLERLVVELVQFVELVELVERRRRRRVVELLELQLVVVPALTDNLGAPEG